MPLEQGLFQPAGEGNPELEFDAAASVGIWPFLRVDGDVQQRDYHRWPFIESLSSPGLQSVLWADGNGKVIVNNPHRGESLILSLVDPSHPIRLLQDCPAEDLTDGLDSSAFEASSGSSQTWRAFDNDGQSSFFMSSNSGDEWLSIDFGEEAWFNFISLRTDASQNFDVTVEIAGESGDFTAIVTRRVPSWPGIDIEAGPQRAHRVRFRTTAPIAVHEVEIYRYAEELDGDPYESNDQWTSASRLGPGSYRDPNIDHAEDVDFYELELLSANVVRATVDYDSTLAGELQIELWSWPSGLRTGDPELLSVQLFSETLGARIRHHAEWTSTFGHATPILARIVPEDSFVGAYTLMLQTRGPELSGVIPANTQRRAIHDHPGRCHPAFACSGVRQDDSPPSSDATDCDATRITAGIETALVTSAFRWLGFGPFPLDGRELLLGVFAAIFIAKLVAAAAHLR